MVGSQSQTFGYNQSGQLVKRFQGGSWLNFTWDALGRLAWAGPGAAGNSDSVPVVTSATPAVAPAGSSKFSYDVDSTRRLRVDPSGAKTLYLDGFEVAKPAVGASTVSKYYAIDGESVAMRRQQLAGAAVPVVIEAEAGVPAVVSDNTNVLDPIGGASGGSARVYSGGWSNFIRFSLGATVAGTYSVKLRYSTAANTASTRRVLANGVQVSNSQSLPATGWAWGETTFNVTMTANAAGTIQFTTDPGNGSSGEVYFDKIEITAPAGSGNGAGTVTHLFANYQGSVVMASDHNTALASTVVRNRYAPYGENRASDAIAQTQHGWIGQTEDPTGLAYLNARYYDPKTGRFLSPDPLTDPYRPAMLNGYTYGFNNPGSLTDPSGLGPWGWVKDKASGTAQGVKGAYDCVRGNCAVGRPAIRGEGPPPRGNPYADALDQQVRNALPYILAAAAAATVVTAACLVACEAAAVAATPWLYAAANAAAFNPVASAAAGAAVTGGTALAAGDSPQDAAIQAAAAFGLSYVGSGGGGRGSSSPTLFRNLAPEDPVLNPNSVPVGQLPSISGRFNYVVTADGSLVVGRASGFRPGGGHIDLARGGSVMAAGEVHIVNGTIRMFNSNSGHYQPSGESPQVQASEAFQRAGLSVRDAVYRAFGG